MWDTIFVICIVCTLTYILNCLLHIGPKKVKFYFKYFFFYLYTFLAASVVLPWNLLRPKDPENQKRFCYLMAYVAELLNVNVELRDIKFLAEEGGAIIVVNHQSALDAIAYCHLVNMVKYNITVIAKKVLFYIWPFGLSAYLAGVIFINRQTKKNGYKQLEVTKDLIVKKKTKVWFYPEGTRNKNPTRLLPFKKGAFYLAVEMQVPILIGVLSPYYFVNKKKHTFDKGHIIMQCLKPVPTKGLTKNDVPDLVNQVYDKMNAVYKELSKEVNGVLPPEDRSTAPVE